MKMKTLTALMLSIGLVLTGCAGGGDTAQKEAPAAEAAADAGGEAEAEAAEEKAEDAAEDAAEKAEDAAEDAAEKAEDAAEDAAEKTEDAEDDDDMEDDDEEAGDAEDDGISNLTENADGTVDVLLPADYVDGSTQEDLDSFISDYNLDSISMNEDGSATIHTSKESYTAMLKTITAELEEEMAEIPGSDYGPDITGVEHNEDFTKFTIMKSSQEMGEYELMFCEELFSAIGEYYGLYAGRPISSVLISWVDETTGDAFKVLQTDETDDDSAADAYYSDEESAIYDALTASENSHFSATVADNDTFKFEFTGMTVDDFSYIWQFHVDNKSDKALTLTSGYVAINGILCMPNIYETVPAGESLDGELYWTLGALADSHVSDVSVVSFDLEAYLEGGLDDLCPEPVLIYPNGEENAKYDFYEARENEDQVIMDDANGKIIVTGFEKDDYSELSINLYGENTSDKDFYITMEDCKVNGVDVTNYWLFNLPAGQASYDDISFYTGTLAEYNLEAYDTVEFTLLINDENDLYGDPIAEIPVKLTPVFG